MPEALRVNKFGVLTREGFIPHCGRITKGGVVLHAPIAVVVNIEALADFPAPERDPDGKYLYVLPGGVRVAE